MFLWAGPLPEIEPGPGVFPGPESTGYAGPDCGDLQYPSQGRHPVEDLSEVQLFTDARLAEAQDFCLWNRTSHRRASQLVQAVSRMTEVTATSPEFFRVQFMLEPSMSNGELRGLLIPAAQLDAGAEMSAEGKLSGRQSAGS